MHVPMGFKFTSRRPVTPPVKRDRGNNGSDMSRNFDIFARVTFRVPEEDRFGCVLKGWRGDIVRPMFVCGGSWQAR